MIKRIPLLNDWFFSDSFDVSMLQQGVNQGFVPIQLPHNTVDLPYHYFDETVYQKMTCYKRQLIVPEIMADQIAKLRFEGVMAHAKVYLDGMLIGEHMGGYTPFECILKDAGTFELVVVADASEQAGIPPFGGQIDYLTYSGIYREVYLDLYASVYIQNAQVVPKRILESEKALEVHVHLNNTVCVQDKTIALELVDGSGHLVGQCDQRLTLLEGAQTVTVNMDGLDHIKLWQLEDPVLYTVKISLDANEAFETQIGFRTARFEPDGFYLNGERLKIRGLNRHQAYPYVGYAMPKRVQEKDADLLKYDLGLNLVRTSHYPQSIHFLNRCDAIGLLVFEEIPGWQHVGDEGWQALAITQVKEMIERDYNHPSIVIWGVRINESADFNEFYTKTNALARQLDATRQTGGVRYITGSELLEDVYTMNDFVHDGGTVHLRDQKVVTELDDHVPYMVTEYNGHMHPTKKFDCEERQMSHVLRHLEVQQAAYKDPYIAGAIGWCAFDYNTHKDFGSGDHICYHGVMDMFRIKKFAADVYASQQSPDQQLILRPVTFWARGERSIGGILPLIVLTNCDYLTLQFGDSRVIPVDKRDMRFKDLPYPPFVIDETLISPSQLGEWGMRWEDGIICGYIKGTLVETVKFSKSPIPNRVVLEPDDTELSIGEKDATRVIVRLKDQCDQDLAFDHSVVNIAVDEGCAHLGRIQGPKTFALVGGSFGFYIETYGEAGIFALHVQVGDFEPESLSITIE